MYMHRGVRECVVCKIKCLVEVNKNKDQPWYKWERSIGKKYTLY